MTRGRPGVPRPATSSRPLCPVPPLRTIVLLRPIAPPSQSSRPMKRRAFLRSAAVTAAALTVPAPAFPYIRPRRPLRDVEAITGDGRMVVLTDAALAGLRSQLRGRLLLANDDGYETA